MASYSSWNGLKNHGNPSLLTDVLKGRMGFTGFLIGDWNGHEQVPGCTDVSCPQAFNAGLDMFMAPDSWKGLYANTLAQARSGEIPLARLDDAVRRILRVKVKARLFEADRPVDGQFDRLAAPEHRALAREAVRKSLVLLKNNGSVLPLKASAHVLVAGDGADTIGKQSGGWSITWQGTDTSNADFPNGQSIHAGLAEALAAAGGKAELSPDGSFTTRPDVAIVVFGEQPYAEGKGDIPTLEYQPGTKTDLATLRKLKAAGIPVVAVFLSGRPLVDQPRAQRRRRLRRRLAARHRGRRRGRRAAPQARRRGQPRLHRQALLLLAQDGHRRTAEPGRQGLRPALRLWLWPHLCRQGRGADAAGGVGRNCVEAIRRPDAQPGEPDHGTVLAGPSPKASATTNGDALPSFAAAGT